MGLLFLTYLGFVSLGLPDGATGVAWPSVRDTFHLPQSSLGMILFGAGTGYLISSFFAGVATLRLGLGRLLSFSCFFVATGLTVYGVTPRWPLMVCAAIAVGLGSGAIDAGLNTFAAKAVPPRHMNWLHSSFGFGAMCGPFIMTQALLTSGSWRHGYGVIAMMLAALAAVFFFYREAFGTWLTYERSSTSAASVDVVTAIRSPAVRLNVFAFLLYGGIEATAGQWCYSILTEGRGYSAGAAGILTGAYWAALTIGRIVVGAVVGSAGVTHVTSIAIVLTVLGSLLFAGVPGSSLGIVGLLLLGFALAPFFPTLMSDTPGRVGPDLSTHSIGFQVAAATVGIAAFPALGGWAAARYGLDIIPYIVLVLALLFGVVHRRIVRSPTSVS